MGKNNIRFRVRKGMQVPHKKITVTVKEPVLVLSEEALVLAMQVRLLGSGVELLRSGFKAKSNLFEYVLAGIPEQVRKDIKMKVNGGYTLTMAFLEGEPLPCTQCEVTSHTTMGCPVIAAKREKAKQVLPMR